MALPKLKPNGSIWHRIHSIEHDDESLNLQTWFTCQPCKKFRIFGSTVVITQPSSTFWVYLLGVLTTAVGFYFCLANDHQVSRTLWGISLILWGVGALLAGTSYQAFGYQLKCAGRSKVVWTSWWEVVYLVFQQVSVSVMFVAVAYSCLPEFERTLSVYFAVAVSAVYTFLVGWGAFKPVKSMITFERMVLFCSPFIYFLIGLNGAHYWVSGGALDLALLVTWLGLLVTMWLFYLYIKLGWAQTLWKKSIWFSENDVLHVALIVWALYIALVLQPLVVDY